MTLRSADRLLQRELSFLSKHMCSSTVQQICRCLVSSSSLTDYEVQKIRSMTTDTQQAACLMQTLLRKGRVSCQHFFHCLFTCSPSLLHTLSRGAVGFTNMDHRHVEDISNTEPSATSPSYVIKIHNSYLKNCIIGSNSHLSSLISDTEESNAHTEGMLMPTDQPAQPESQEAHSIQMDLSNVEFVIIGDNNSINVGCDVDSDSQEEPDDWSQ